jgi:hypothetical protein
MWWDTEHEESSAKRAIDASLPPGAFEPGTEDHAGAE